MVEGFNEITGYLKDLIDNHKVDACMAAIVEIDGFDNIRRQHGDEIAEKIMDDADNLLGRVLGPGIRRGRISDDKFLFAIENLEYKDQMRSFVRPVKFGIKRISEESPVLSQKGIKLSCSIGIASYPLDVENYDDLYDLVVKMTDLARDKGGDRYIIYYPDLHYQYIYGNGSIITDSKAFLKYKKLMVVNHFLSRYEAANKNERMDLLDSVMHAFQLQAVFFDDGKNHVIYLIYGKCKDLRNRSDYYINRDYYYESFHEDGLFIINDVERMQLYAPAMYSFFKKNGFEQALEYTDDGLKVNENMSVVSFCRGRFVSRWSETDGVFLGLIADLILRCFNRSDAAMAVQAESIRDQARFNYENTEGLSLAYMGVFSCSLSKNLIEVIRADGFVRQFRAFIEREKDMDRIFKELGERYVLPDDKNTFFDGISPENIKRRLSDRNYFELNICMCSSPEKVHYFRLYFARIGDRSAVDRFILGVTNTDEAVLEEKHKNELLQSLLKEAEQASDAKNRFLSNMSHDLRTPLNAILGYQALVGAHLDDPGKVSDYLDKISKSARVMLDLCNNALNLVRLENSQEYLDEKEEEFNSLLESLKSFAYPMAENKNQSLTFDEDIKHKSAVFDIAKMEKILINILKNALMYTPEGGHIQFSLKEGKVAPNKGYSSFEIVVRDDGVGMSSEFQKNLFDAFERERNTTEAGFYGSGLGLPIVKNLVDLMNGTIECKSAPNEGTEITLYFQFKVTEEPENEKSDEESKISENIDPFKGKRFLVVDDNELNSELATELLEAVGAETDTAYDGAEAVDKIRHMAKGQIDVVLMDAQMPVMNGYEATMAIRNLECGYQKEITILGLSANAFAEDCDRGIKSGMDAYLVKPLNMSVLKEELIRLSS